MSEPTATLKTAAAVAAFAALGPLAGEYTFILAGAFAGALLSLQLAAPMQGWWRPVAHVAAGVLAALVFASSVASLAVVVLPTAWDLSADMLWMPVSALIAMYWRTGLAAASGWALGRFGNDKKARDE